MEVRKIWLMGRTARSMEPSHGSMNILVTHEASMPDPCLTHVTLLSSHASMPPTHGSMVVHTFLQKNKSYRLSERTWLKSLFLSESWVRSVSLTLRRRKEREVRGHLKLLESRSRTFFFSPKNVFHASSMGVPCLSHGNKKRFHAPMVTKNRPMNRPMWSLFAP